MRPQDLNHRVVKPIMSFALNLCMMLMCQSAYAQFGLDSSLADLPRRTAPVITGEVNTDEAHIGDQFTVECVAYNVFSRPVSGVSMSLEVDAGLLLEWINGAYVVTGRAVGVHSLRCVPVQPSDTISVGVGVINVVPEVVRSARVYTSLDSVPTHTFEVGDTLLLHPLGYTDANQTQPARLGSVSTTIYRGERSCEDTTRGLRADLHFAQGETNSESATYWTARRLGRYTFINRFQTQGTLLCVATPVDVVADARPPMISINHPHQRTHVTDSNSSVRVAGYVTDTGSGVSQVIVTTGSHRQEARLYESADQQMYFIAEMPVHSGLFMIQVEALDHAGHRAIATHALHVGDRFTNPSRDDQVMMPLHVRVGNSIITNHRPGIDSVEDALRHVLDHIDLSDVMGESVTTDDSHQEVRITQRVRLGEPQIRLSFSGDRLVLTASFPKFRANISMVCRKRARCYAGALVGHEDGGSFRGRFKAQARGSLIAKIPMEFGVGPGGFASLHFKSDEIEFSSQLRISNSADSGRAHINREIYNKIREKFEEQLIQQLNDVFTSSDQERLSAVVGGGWYGIFFGNWWEAQFNLPSLVGQGDETLLNVDAHLTRSQIRDDHLKLELLTGFSEENTVVMTDVSMLMDDREGAPDFNRHFGAPPRRDLDAAVHINTVNAALYAAWLGGAFNLEIPLAEALEIAGEPAPDVNGLELPWGSVFPTATLKVSPKLPPRISDDLHDPGQAYVQFGALQVEYDLQDDYGSSAHLEASLISKLNIEFTQEGIMTQLSDESGCDARDHFFDCGFQRALALTEERSGMHLEAEGAQIQALRGLGVDPRPMLFERLGALTLDESGRASTTDDETFARALWLPLESVIINMMSQRIEFPLIRLTSLMSEVVDLPGFNDLQVQDARFADRHGLINDGWLMFEGNVTSAF